SSCWSPPLSTPPSPRPSLHDALPISDALHLVLQGDEPRRIENGGHVLRAVAAITQQQPGLDLRRRVADAEAHHEPVELRLGEGRSEEHTSELQSRENLVCRLLLEKKQ